MIVSKNRYGQYAYGDWVSALLGVAGVVLPMVLGTSAAAPSTSSGAEQARLAAEAAARKAEAERAAAKEKTTRMLLFMGIGGAALIGTALVLRRRQG